MLEFEYPEGLLNAEPPFWYVVIGAGTGRVIRNPGGPAAAPQGSAPVLLVLEPGGSEADAFVSRYDSEGRFIADTWYASREEAVEEAATEFGNTLGEWRPVPENTEDVEAFVFADARY